MAKRKDRTGDEKLTVLDKFHDLKKESPSIGLRGAADKLGISKSGLAKLIKDEVELRRRAAAEEHGPTGKRMRHGKDKDIEAALLTFYHWARQRNTPLNGPFLMQQATKIAEKAGVVFNPTAGWLTRWKKRNGLVFVTLKGEAAEADTASAEDFLKNEWPELERQFPPENRFNTDETAVYYRALPDSTYVNQKSKASAKGFKTAKDRLTVLVTCSQVGEMLDLLVIGKSKAPRSFKGKNMSSRVRYTFSKNAWMTSRIWEQFLRDLDLEMGRQKRKILLLADNCSAHTRVHGLKNITLRFLPPNTTSVLQPCDQGIIRALKAVFRTKIRGKILTILEDLQAEEDNDTETRNSAHTVVKKLDVMQAMEMLSTAWKSVKTSTIVNCWKKGGFCPPEERGTEIEIPMPLPEDLPESEAEIFLGWASIDDDSEVAEEATAEELTQELAAAVAEANSTDEPEDQDEDDEEEDPEPPVSAKEMRLALSVLETGLHQQGFEIPEFENVIKTFRQSLRQRFPLKQARLDSFFSL